MEGSGNACTVTSKPINTVTPAERFARNKFQEFENEKALFRTNPHLFEKRTIIIDGSNIAYK